MKRVIRCSEDHSAMIIPSILDEFGKNEPGTGCTFIADDGTFVNIYPELDIHEDLCDWVEDNFDIKLKYKDEEYFVREYGWIRLRKDPNMCVVELPNERPTNAEWYSLEEWLEWVEEITSGREISLYINILDTQIYSVEVAFGKEMFTDGLLKMLKGYYTSHRLIASKGVNMKRVIKASQDIIKTYVVKIWYEVDPGHDTAGPVADEEVIFVDAKTKEEAIREAKKEWDGPIDRIDVVGVYSDEDKWDSIPFEADTQVGAADTYKGYEDINDYASNTARDDIEFDIPQIWSIQFFGDKNYMISDCEVHVMARTYAEAEKQAKFLCKVWDYDFEKCTIQYAYLPRSWWNNHEVKLEGFVQYVEE